jgi:hypothetical protein
MFLSKFFLNQRLPKKNFEKHRRSQTGIAQKFYPLTAYQF